MELLFFTARLLLQEGDPDSSMGTS